MYICVAEIIILSLITKKMNTDQKVLPYQYDKDYNKRIIKSMLLNEMIEIFKYGITTAIITFK